MRTWRFKLAVVGLAVMFWSGVPAVLSPFQAVWPPARACAGELAKDLRLAGITIPRPPKGKGKQCVADTDFMRRNHMNLLLHQRDQTVHKGVRTTRFSLKGCVTCHAVNGEDGLPVTNKDPRFFCRTCHDYAAVKIDCFECHASRPAKTLRTMLPTTGNAVGALAGYLEELKQ